MKTYNLMTKLSVGLVFLIGFLSAQNAFAAGPLVATKNATSITSTSAVMNGVLVSDGGAPITSVGFRYGSTIAYGSTVLSTVPSFSYTSQFGVPGYGAGEFNQPTQVAINPVNGRRYVIEENASSGRVQIFSSAGMYISEFGGVGTDNGQFNTTGGIALDADGNVYVTDVGNNRVQKFSPSGTYLSQFGTSGSGNGQFMYPYGITIDHQGNILIADSQNHRIQKFDANGTYLTQFGTFGTGNGQFNMPIFLAVDSSNNIFVTDLLNNRVQKFSPSGTYLSQFGTSGSGNGQFMYPYGITIDAMNTIFVADMMNNRIQEFTAGGAYITQFGTYGVNNGQFQSPVGVTVDTEGNLLVVDTGGGRIEKFSRTFSAPTTFKCGSVYHYQAFAINANATVYGNDVTFSTMNCSARPNLAAAAANTIPKPIASPVLPITGIPKK